MILPFRWTELKGEPQMMLINASLCNLENLPVDSEPMVALFCDDCISLATPLGLLKDAASTEPSKLFIR